MTRDEKIPAVLEWQNDSTIHPLTCGNDSSHGLLVPFTSLDTPDGVGLVCVEYDWKQTKVPIVVYQRWLRSRRRIQGVIK